MLMKNARPLHALEAGTVHEALGGRRVRHGQNHEVRARQLVVEPVGVVQLFDAWRLVLAPAIDADHGDTECRGQPRRLGADAADPDDEGSGFRQVDDVAGLPPGRTPLAAQLLRDSSGAARGQTPARRP